MRYSTVSRFSFETGMAHADRAAVESLFRREAIEGRRRQLAGDVMIRSPLLTLPFTVAIGAVIASCLIASLVIPMHREVRVHGWVVPRNGLIEVTSPATGTIAELLVREGARVKKGDRLLGLDTDAKLAGGDSMAMSLLISSRNGETLLRDREQTIVVGQRAVADALQRKFARLAMEKHQFENVLLLKRKRAVILANQVDQYRQLTEKGFGSGQEFQRRQSELLSAQQDILEGEIRVAATDREMKELQDQVRQNDTTTTLLLNELKQQRLSLSTEAVRTSARGGASVLAPASGIIGQLPVKTGQVVASSSLLASIVPDGGFQIRLMFPARTAGLPDRGARVRVLVDAFPYQKFGALTGTVVSVARSTTPPDDNAREMGVREAYFDVIIALDGAQEKLEKFDLRSGMSVTGVVELEQRSLLSWLVTRA